MTDHHHYYHQEDSGSTSSFLFGIILGAVIGAVIAIIIYRHNKSDVIEKLQTRISEIIAKFTNSSTVSGFKNKAERKDNKKAKTPQAQDFTPAGLNLEKKLADIINTETVTVAAHKKSTPKMFVKPKK